MVVEAGSSDDADADAVLSRWPVDNGDDGGDEALPASISSSAVAVVLSLFPPDRVAVPSILLTLPTL